MPPILRKKILLVEDEEATCKVMMDMLSKGGLDVMHAADGTQALALAKKEKPNLILLDLVIPGLSGLDVLSTLKKDPDTAAIPVMILSQLSDQDSISRGISLGAIGYLVKSEYQLEDILGKVKEMLK